MSFSLKRFTSKLRRAVYTWELSILFFMSFSLKRNTHYNLVVKTEKLSILFFMSFSLKPNSYKTDCLSSQISLNPLFHELFSETEKTYNFFLPVYGVALSILFFMSFSLKLQREILGWCSFCSLSILFFMSFSLKLSSTSIFFSRSAIVSQSSFSWAFLWNLKLN